MDQTWLKVFVDEAFRTIKARKGSISSTSNANEVHAKEFLQELLRDGVVNNELEEQHSTVRQYIREVRKFLNFFEKDSDENVGIVITRDDLYFLVESLKTDELV
mgnify:CR=1 FL=1